MRECSVFRVLRGGGRQTGKLSSDRRGAQRGNIREYHGGSAGRQLMHEINRIRRSGCFAARASGGDAGLDEKLSVFGPQSRCFFVRVINVSEYRGGGNASGENYDDCAFHAAVCGYFFSISFSGNGVKLMLGV